MNREGDKEENERMERERKIEGRKWRLRRGWTIMEREHERKGEKRRSKERKSVDIKWIPTLVPLLSIRSDLCWCSSWYKNIVPDAAWFVEFKDLPPNALKL